MTTIEGRARLVELAMPHIQRLRQGVFRDMMLARMRELSGIDTVQLRNSGNKTTTRKALRGKNHVKSIPSPLRVIVALLLQCPKLAELAGRPERFQHFSGKGVNLLIRLLELLQANPDLSAGAILEHWRDKEEKRYLAELASWAPPLEDEASLEAEFRGALIRLEQRLRELRTEELLNKAREHPLSPAEKDELQRLLSRNGG